METFEVLIVALSKFASTDLELKKKYLDVIQTLVTELEVVEFIPSNILEGKLGELEEFFIEELEDEEENEEEDEDEEFDWDEDDSNTDDEED